MTVEKTPVQTLKRQYPHVDDVEDWRAQQSLRLVWDRLFALEERLRASEGTVGDLVSAANRQEDQLTRVDHKADEALAIAQLTRSEKAAAADVGEGGGPPSGPLVWAWKDFGGPSVDSPYATGPQTIADYKTWFFTLIDRAEGDPATDDWEQVLTDSGIPTGLPAGVPPNDSMPHWAVTQQIGAGGVRGRLFLPTSEADSNGYFSHPFDLLDSAPPPEEP